MKTRALPLLLAACLSSCVIHSRATEFNGVDGIRGEPIEYQTTTLYGLKFLFTWDLWGKSSLQAAVDEFTEEASGRGATRVNISDTSGTTFWFIYPPLSFLFHPTVCTVEGTVEGTAGGGE